MYGQKSHHWLYSLLQPVTYLGVAMAAVVVMGAIYLARKDRTDDFDTALRQGANLAQVFEGFVSRTIKSADNTLRYVRMAYEHDPDDFNINDWSRDLDSQNDLVEQITIIGADGKIITSTRPGFSGIYTGDREHFQAHVDSTTDELFISKPLVLRTQNRWAIVLSRRISARDGSFAGAISAIINPHTLAKHYGTLDLGKDGIASLVGFDGVIRARGGRGHKDPDSFGRSIISAKVFELYKDAPTGYYWNAPGTVDPTKRLISYRVVEGFPLIAIVGISESDVYLQAGQNALIYYVIAAGILLVIAAAIWFGAARERKFRTIASSLTETNARFETALANMPHGLCMFDSEQRLIVRNELYGKMYSIPPDLMKQGTHLQPILDASITAGHHLMDPTDYVGELRDAKSQANAAQFVTYNRLTGKIYAVDRRPLPEGGWIAIHQDVTAQKRTEAEITHLAHYDGLTSLANRVCFLKHVGLAAEKNSKTSAQFAIHLLDLDRFKEVNDTLGHVTGDKLLKAVALRLTFAVGGNDLVARLGGDEFAVLQNLDDDISNGSVTDLAERLLATIREPFEIDGQQITIETSDGIALMPEHGLEAERLLKNADLALYKAKSEGRNTFRVFEASLEHEAQTRRATETDLRAAIAHGEFELHYQPIMDLASGQTAAVEALVRWKHPERGLVAPDEFIPIAEDTGLIAQLGEWVLRKACEDAATWPEHIKIAVNLSPIQFRRRDLVDTISDALDKSGLASERLELEITESVLLQEDENNLTILHQLRALGISIVLDDFGTGYSSFSYLQRFPFDKIKIDRSFVANLTTRPDCAAIVCAITGLAKSLDIRTTAEGVETQEQLELLRAAGCTQVQGFLLGFPCPESMLVIDETSRKNAAA
jgi:diguanylate cyclase (GGDEF)-like protein